MYKLCISETFSTMKNVLLTARMKREMKLFIKFVLQWLATMTFYIKYQIQLPQFGSSNFNQVNLSNIS